MSLKSTPFHHDEPARRQQSAAVSVHHVAAEIDGAMGIEVHTIGNHDVVTVSGEVDIASAPSLRETLLSVLADGTHELVIDLDQVTFLDSTGIGVLVAAFRRASAEGGSMSLVCNSPRSMRVLEITGLTTVFTFHESVAAAVTSHIRLVADEE